MPPDIEMDDDDGMSDARASADRIAARVRQLQSAGIGTDEIAATIAAESAAEG
jgi:hypothetical protein